MKPLDLFPQVGLEDNLYVVARILLDFRKQNNNCKVIIVQNDKGPAGLITIRNILKSIEPDAFHISQWSVPVFWPGLWTEQMNELKKVKVRDCFVPTKMVSVQAEQGLMRAVYCFNRTKMPVLAVLEGQNMVGVLETSQILNEVLQAMLNAD